MSIRVGIRHYGRIQKRKKPPLPYYLLVEEEWENEPPLPYVTLVTEEWENEPPLPFITLVTEEWG